MRKQRGTERLVEGLAREVPWNFEQNSFVLFETRKTEHFCLIKNLGVPTQVMATKYRDYGTTYTPLDFDSDIREFIDAAKIVSLEIHVQIVARFSEFILQ